MQLLSHNLLVESEIQSLDLSYLVQRLIKTLAWSCQEAENSIRRYKNYLLLIHKYPAVNFVPTADIDEVWHAHILHTANYVRDCNALFGRYLHHTPATDSDSQENELAEHYALSAQLYRNEFKESYSLDMDVREFW